MYRRIKLINHFTRPDGTIVDMIHGLMRLSICIEVPEAWVEINGPRKAINKNVRFYFTEAGWEKFGRNTVAACIRHGQGYRVLAVEEHDVDVMYKDAYQVCLRPKRKERPAKPPVEMEKKASASTLFGRLGLFRHRILGDAFQKRK